MFAQDFFVNHIFPFQIAILDYNDDDKVGILKVVATFISVCCCCFLCFDLCTLVSSVFNLLWHMKVFQCILNIVGYALTSCRFFLIISTITCILGLYFDICFY